MLQPRKSYCVLAFLAVIQLQVAAAKQCPQGWYGNLNRCYFFSENTANWNTAKDICTGRGAVLATINSVAEAAFLTKQALAVGNRKGYYIGTTDKGSEGKWRNVDNSPFPTDKSIWGRGQPDNNRKVEHCGSYLPFNKYKLNDAPCNSGYNYICERDIAYRDPCDSVNGWHLIKDKCYRFVREPTDWATARKFCQDSDGDLLSINSKEELGLVSESVACDNKSPIWLGYSDLNVAKLLQWVDGSKTAASVTRWDTKNGEPSATKYAKGNNCAASITLNKNLWELTNCIGNDMSYICEKKKGQCPRGWTTKNGECTRTFYARRTWPQARQACESFGGRLATVADVAKGVDALATRAGIWLSVTDRGSDGQFVDLDGNPIPTSALSAQKPNKLAECGMWLKAKMYLWSCYRTRYYTCYASMGATVPKTPLSDGLMCYTGWVKYKGSCYQRAGQSKNYAAAKVDCAGKQATLVVINDQEEMDFIVGQSRLVNSIVWIGYDDLKVTKKYQWVDGSPSTFTYWRKGEPNNARNKEHCAEMQRSTHNYPATWNDIPCNLARSYICEAKAVTGTQITTPKPTRPWSQDCGQGWISDHLSGHCYYFSLDQQNWQSAKKTCEKMKSKLMSIASKYEQSFVQGMLRGDTSGAIAYWVGGNDLDAEQGWRWTDYMPFKYFNWNNDRGEPNSAGDEDCIEVVQQNGKWNDNNCNAKRNYICERKPAKTTKPSIYNTTPLPTISDDCKVTKLMSGEHWVPDSAFSSSSVRNSDTGPENARIDWTAADKRVSVSTPNKYRYQPIANLNLKGTTYIQFTVQACNDAHISLQPAVENMTRDAYEIVIGGWGNSQSVIRSEHQGSLLTQFQKKGLLNCNKANPFWISWATGKIQVGTGYKVSGSTMFMQTAVTDSLTVSGFAVTTGWGATGKWVVNNPHGSRKGAWSPKYTVKKVPIGTEQFIYGQWIQVNFAKPTLITTVTTKGSATANEYVVEFYLEYSYDKPYNFQPYMGTGSDKIYYFPGNKDKNTAVINKIALPFEAQYVRLRPRKFINYPSLRWGLNGCPPPKYCDPERLVTGVAWLPNWCITASSNKDGSVYDSRMTALPTQPAPNGWLAAAPDATPNILSEEWIQIFLRRDMLIHGVVTKGHAKQPYWVKSFQVQTKTPTGGYKLINYQEPYGTIKTFTANTDQNTAVTNMFGNPVIARWIRILPKEYNKMIGMRVDVLGCLAGCVLSPLLNGRNPIPNGRLSASSSVSAAMGPSRVRLDTSGYGGAWVGKTTKDRTVVFFQVDFGITERVRAITTQGRADQDQWVKYYSVSYSNDGKKFYSYARGVRFTGNTDRNSKRKTFFPTQITAQAVRIIPKSWNTRPAMRIELYGCSGSNSKHVGCFTEGSHADSFEGPTSYFSYNGPAKCAASCFKDGYMYAGLNRRTCKCGSTLPIGGESKRCNYKCRGNNKFMCGGYVSGVVSVYETGIGPDDERCPTGYETYNNKCFKVVKIKRSWHDSRATCMADGGDLATINSWADQSYIKTKLGKLDMGAWIGLNDLRDQMSFEWADGSPVLATYWQHSEPNNYLGKNEDCVEAISWGEMKKAYAGLKSQNGWWNDRQCEESRYSICQKKKERNATPLTTVAPPKGCPFGWKAFQSSCYLLIEHSSTWSLSSYTCRKEGGTLVRINDDFEQNFLTTELFARTGYSYSKAKTLYWTDLRQNTATKEFVWSNMWDVIPYTKWDKGQPPAVVTAGTGRWTPKLINCVVMNGKNEKNTGFWKTQSCSAGGFPLCERPRTGYAQPPLPTLAPEDIACPTGWVGVGPNCYQVNTPTDKLDMKMWLDAEKHCVKQGSHLAYINNGTENEYLWRNYILQPGSDNNRFWIGLNDRAADKGYKWVSGDAFSYSNWKSGEPNDWDGLEPCAMLDGADGLWNDEKCHLPMNWICSISRTNVKKIRKITTTPKPTAGPSGSCADGDDWKSFQGHCYYLNTDLLTFREANTYCNGKGAHLVSIQASLENSFVRVISQSLVTSFNGRKASRVDIGGVFTQVWTGLNEIDRSKGHRWVDGSAYSFSNWAQNEPNDWNGGEYCVGMIVSTSEWNDIHCSARLPSVCEKDPKQTGPITTVLPPHIDSYCPTGYMGFENDCYKIVVDKRLNWTTAAFTCETEGGHLASVMNHRQQTFLTSQLNIAKQAKVALWLGLQHGSATKKAFFRHDTAYVWASNVDVTYTNWNHGEPNGISREACTEMLYNPAGRWNDLNCPSERGYICKKPKDGSVKTPPPEDNSRCPSGYTHWQSSCYKYISAKGTWSYIDGNTCGTDGAHLVSVQDPYEYSFIRTWLWKQKVTDDIWIGLRSLANTNSFTWSNQWPVVVTYWDKNEPANFKLSEGCVLMDTGNGEDSGKWRHTTCNQMQSAICKKPLNAPSIQTPQSGFCRSAAGETWFPNIDGYCYLFNIDPRYTFDDAESACRTAGANLASVHSDADISFITTQMEHMDVVGGNGGTKNVWIGLKKQDSGAFVWTDNSAVYYANWADKEPNSVENNEKCTELYSPNANWNDVDCQSKRGFICKIKQGTQPAIFPTPINAVPTTLPTTTKRTSPCQLNGWSFYNGSCYLMVSQPNEFLRWNEADDYCKAPGREAHLASIQSEAENQWIVEKLLPSNGQADAWLGLAELQRDNSLRWTDNSLISYINWDTNQPSTNKGSMECVAMRVASGDASGRWATEYCFAQKAFICEIDAKTKISAVVGTRVTDGSLCHFPFKYRGQLFNTCTTYGSSFLWCATTDHYEQDRKFAICDPFRCPPGWRRHNRLCYYFSTAVDKRSWKSAEQSCDSMNSDLGFIGSAAVESFITDNINEYFWIGLNDQLRERSFMWDHRPRMVMIRGFTNWGIGEPRSIFGTEDCAQIVNGPYADNRPGEWVMANCDLARRYICMKDASFTLNPSTEPPTIKPITKAVTTPPTPRIITLPPQTAPNKGSTPPAGTGTTPTPGVPGGKGAQLGGTQATAGGSSSPGKVTAGAIVAIVVACIAALLAGVFIFLYVRKIREGQQGGGTGGLGFENAAYTKSSDSVHVGLENPNFSVGE